jgi:hypothetical protein
LQITPRVYLVPFIILNLALASMGGYLLYRQYATQSCVNLIYELDLQACMDHPDQETELIYENFYPFLQILDKHPNWKCDVVIPGFAIPILAENYTNVWNLLQNLTVTHQIEISVFEYTYTPVGIYPASDMTTQVARSKETALNYSLLISPTVILHQMAFSPSIFFAEGSSYNYSNLLVDATLLRTYGVNTEKPIVSYWAGNRMTYLVLFDEFPTEYMGYLHHWYYYQNGGCLKEESESFRIDIQKLANIEYQLYKMSSNGVSFYSIATWVQQCLNNGQTYFQSSILPGVLPTAWSFDQLYFNSGSQYTPFINSSVVGANYELRNALYALDRSFNNYFRYYLTSVKREYCRSLLDSAWLNLDFAKYYPTTDVGSSSDYYRYIKKYQFCADEYFKLALNYLRANIISINLTDFQIKSYTGAYCNTPETFENYFADIAPVIPESIQSRLNLFDSKFGNTAVTTQIRNFTYNGQSGWELRLITTSTIIQDVMLTGSVALSNTTIRFCPYGSEWNPREITHVNFTQAAVPIVLSNGILYCNNYGLVINITKGYFPLSWAASELQITVQLPAGTGSGVEVFQCFLLETEISSVLNWGNQINVYQIVHMPLAEAMV